MIDQRNFTYMFYGFAAAWVIVTIYVGFLALREGRLRDELERVRRMVEDSGKKN
jgi:CcmD family protein